MVDGKPTDGAQNILLKIKDYVSKSFKVDLAQDYYCTLASYVSADNRAWGWRNSCLGGFEDLACLP